MPLSLEFMTMRRIVQSTVIVKRMSRMTPVSRPAWRSAYGCPMIPAPLQERVRLEIQEAKWSGMAHMMLLAMFIKALDIELLGLALSSRSSGLKSDSATVTAGASMPVRRGARWPALCLLLLQLSAVR